MKGRDKRRGSKCTKELAVEQERLYLASPLTRLRKVKEGQRTRGTDGGQEHVTQNKVLKLKKERN